MDRFFMFTWRTYGTWVPGQAGFVGQYIAADGRRTINHVFGTPASDPLPALEGYSRSVQTNEPTHLSAAHADEVLQGVREAGIKRRHVVHAVAVMEDHLHLVFDACDPARDMGRMLADWKALVTFRLNCRFGVRPWWAEKGSKRWYPRCAFRQVVKYVRDQSGILAAMFSPEAEAALTELEPGT